MQPNVVLDGHTIEPTRPEQTKSATEEKSLPPSAGLFWRALALSSTACVAWLHACAGRGRRAFKQSVSPSAVDGGRDAQLGRRWFEVSGEKERDPKKNCRLAFLLGQVCLLPSLRSLILVRLHRQTRTHARHAQRRQMAGRQGTLADWAESGNELPVSGPCARDAGDSCRRAANHMPVPCGGAWRGGLPSLGIGWS